MALLRTLSAVEQGSVLYKVAVSGSLPKVAKRAQLRQGFVLGHGDTQLDLDTKEESFCGEWAFSGGVATFGVVWGVAPLCIVRGLDPLVISLCVMWCDVVDYPKMLLPRTGMWLCCAVC